LLDAFLVKKCSFSRLAYITFLTPPAAYAEKKETVSIQAPRFSVKAKQPFSVQIDGEILAAAGSPRLFKKIDFVSVPQALKIIS
ncbi:MAG TPA: hypothetical protein VLQ89_07090, partial [Candidatus Binatia bacterium]|nr:hypothetical protein [Candidatus Binatia bacterium]